MMFSGWIVHQKHFKARLNLDLQEQHASLTRPTSCINEHSQSTGDSLKNWNNYQILSSTY